MDAAVVVRGQRAFDFQLLLQIIFELGIDVIDDRLEAVFFVYLIAVTDCVANCQLKHETHYDTPNFMGRRTKRTFRRTLLSCSS